MPYVNDILNRLENSGNWPSFERSDFLDELNELAEEAFNNKTFEGYLASVLIYHQLTEEFLRIIIECSTFYIQLCVFPQEYQERKLKRKMIGQLIEKLNESALDNETHRLVEKAFKLNELRIIVVYKLTRSGSIGKIETECVKVQKMYNDRWKLFDEIYDRYRVTFKDFRKNIDELKELIE